MLIFNLASLVCLGIIDFVTYKIPNVLLTGWIVTSIFINIMDGTITISDTIQNAVFSLLVAGSFIPLRHIVYCNAGDFKLYGVITVILGIKTAMVILFVTCVMSFFPLASGVKKVQLAFLTLFGYIAFLIFISGGLKWKIL